MRRPGGTVTINQKKSAFPRDEKLHVRYNERETAPKTGMDPGKLRSECPGGGNAVQKGNEKIMKIMTASDIHGSAPSCEKMLDAFRRERADRLLLLGDLLYHGPRNDLPEDYAPKEVIPLLNAVKNRLLCVRGNCDTEVDQMVLEFPILSESCILWLGGRMVFATHGHHFNTGSLPPLQPGDILLHGHTHVPAWETFLPGSRDGSDTKNKETCLYLNPGSVSLPKENSPRGYLILTEQAVEWKTLEGETYHRLSL